MGSSFVVVHYLMYSRRLVVSTIIFFLAIAGTLHAADLHSRRERRERERDDQVITLR